MINSSFRLAKTRATPLLWRHRVQYSMVVMSLSYFNVVIRNEFDLARIITLGLIKWEIERFMFDSI